MKLTVKDKEFLERLRELMQKKELSVDLKTDGYKRMVLRGNYGDKIDRRQFRHEPAGCQVAVQPAGQRVLPSFHPEMVLLPNPPTEVGTSPRLNRRPCLCDVL
jgi:hypothetical protein